jgi:glycosyltransferase involved in cell wall biosynthesis
MTAAPPRVSVVICTHNRAERLGDAIGSVLAQDSAGVPFELLVVDNRSTDGTRDTVERFGGDRRVRYVWEPALGLCHARNTGGREARGEYIAYLDDDAVACAGWLQAIPAAFEAMADVGVVGGRVEPIWEAARPTWLSDDVALSLTIVDWSVTPTVITDVRNQWLVGANMAVRAKALRAVGGFHPRLDRVGTRMLSSGDVYLQKQIMARGYRCFYAPAMAVRHAVPASRLTKRWFRRRYYSQGLSDAVMQLLDGHTSPRARASSALTTAARLLVRPHDLAALLCPTNDPVRFTRKCFAWIAVGTVAGMIGGARQ